MLLYTQVNKFWTMVLIIFLLPGIISIYTSVQANRIPIRRKGVVFVFVFIYLSYAVNSYFNV